MIPSLSASRTMADPFRSSDCCTAMKTNDWDCSGCASEWKWSAAPFKCDPRAARGRRSTPAFRCRTPREMEALREDDFMPNNSMTKTIHVLLAEDHAIVREGFRKLLEAEEDFAVVGEADNGRTAVEMTKRLRPDVVVMDIAMPLLNGLEATRQILKELPATRVLILSAHSDDAYIEHLNAVGAAGYLIKQTSSH